MNFSREGNCYLTITSSYEENAQDMILSSIYNLLVLLDFSDPKLDEDIIDNLKNIVEGLRDKEIE